MAFFADLLSPPPTFVNVFPISLGKKCPVSHSCQWSVTCRVREKEAFRRAGNARFPRQGHTCGRSIWEDCQLPASGQARGNSFGREGAREVSAIAEAPCDGTDGCVPFVLPPDVRLRPCSLPKWSETDAGTGQPVRQGVSARQ